MRCCTVPNVYFQKWVAIENKRLWGLYICIYITVVALVATAIGLFQVYIVPVDPHLRLQIWKDVSVSGGTCPTGNYDYDPGNGTGNWAFQGASCAQLCSSGMPSAPGSGACVTEAQLAQQDGDSIFFATAFNEEVSWRYHGDQTWMANHFSRWYTEVSAGQNASAPDTPCPFPVTTTNMADARMCKKKASYLLPDWTEGMTAKWDMGYQIKLPDSFAHAMAGKQLLETTGCATVIKSASGSTIKQFAAGEMTSITLKDALTAAELALSDVIGEQADLPNNQQRAKIQAVGATLVFHMEVTNNGEGGTPKNEVTVTGVPGFVLREETDVLDAYGSLRARSYSGVRIKFSSRGTFSWFRMDRFLYVFTMCCVWLQLPGMIFFAFAMRFLGTLSEAYAGFTYEHIDLNKEVIGVSARTLSYSFSYEDASDFHEEHEGKIVYGMSLRQVRRRLQHVLNGHQTLTGPERKLFTEFFLANAEGVLPSGRKAVCYDFFLNALSSNENLRGFQDVVSIVDPDGSSKNALEYVFPDNTVEAMEALGRRRRVQAKGTDSLVPHDTKMIVMNRLKLQSSIWAAQRCNLTRCQLGQEALEQQLEKLQSAGNSLHDFASKLGGAGEEPKDEAEAAE
ncbi:unnamed protein product [Effrenium voratum]|uniref:Uncharacterized protein n=1 Tax=Effrenium voratum TaxID=2562239 RepID=A0AA36HSW2_9DINO|nr:unnamed protein product [Effrenium voratum]CAJ1419471.1 unnamed protein product [Effrenium voratum]